MKKYLIVIIILILSACQNTNDSSEGHNETGDSEKFSLFLLSNSNLNSQFDVEINYSELDYSLASALVTGKNNTVDSLTKLVSRYEQLKENVQIVQNEINKYHKIVTGVNAPHINSAYSADKMSSMKTIKQLYLITGFSSNPEKAENVVIAFNQFLVWSIQESDSLQKHASKLANTGVVVGQKDILFKTLSDLIMELENSNDLNNIKKIQLIFAAENSMYHIENWFLHFYFKIIKRIEKETEVNTLYSKYGAQ